MWLEGGGAGPVRLVMLGEDLDWCDRIVWSADSMRVAFLVRDAPLLIFDAAHRIRLFDQWLVNTGGYPTEEVAEELGMGPDGKVVTYRECARTGGRYGEVKELMIPSGEEGSGTTTPI